MQHQQYAGMFSKPPDQVNHSRQMQHGGNVPGGGGIGRNQYIHHPPQGPIYQHQQVCYPSSGGMYSTRRAAPVRVSLLRDIGIAGERDKDYSTIPQSALAGFGGKMPPAFITQSKGFSIPASNQLHERNQLMFTSKLPHGGFPQMPTSNMKLDTRALTSTNTATSPQLAGLHLVHGGIKKEQTLLVHQEVPQGKYPPTHPHYHHHHHHTSLSESSPASQGNLVPVPDNNSNIKAEDVPEDQSAGANDSKIKEELLRVMLQVDNQITEAQKELKSLDEKKELLEAKKNKAEEEPEKAAKELEEEASRMNIEPKHRDLWQVIYAENRKKSEKSMSLLDGFGSCYHIPLYNQPSDTQVYHDNIKSNDEMRPKLIKFFQQKKRLQKVRAQYTAARYEELQENWQQKVEQIENSPKQKAKDAKARELFEKVFPDIRKQRVQQERTDRAGTRGSDACRSEADFAEIVDGLSEQENQLQQMRHLAVVPPRLLDREERKVQFINNNGLIREPFKVFKESMCLDSWTEKEKKIFMEKYVQHPKNFHLIASFIEKKEVSDAILYYYLTKKTNHYKQMVRKHSLKPKKPKPGRNNQVAVTTHQQEQTPVKDVSIKSDKVEMEKEKKNEVEERRIDRPPSPRMTRARMQTLNWKEEEISIVKEGFAKHGKDFLAVSRMLNDKTEQQVRNYFNNYKKKHGFEQLVENNKKKKGYESRRPRRGQSPTDTTTIPTATLNTTSTVTSSTIPSNIDADTPQATTDDAGKGSTKKDKNNDDLNKNGGENQNSSSSSISSCGSKHGGSDSNDSSVKMNLTSTSQMRTRRKTAAIAAAAVSSLAAQDAEVTPGYKRSSSRPASGEPSDKKAKKSEAKKSKHLKTNNALEKDMSQNTEEKKNMRGDYKKHDTIISEDVSKRAISKVKSEVVTSGGEEKVNKSAAQTTKTSSSSSTSGGDLKTTTTAANSRTADTTDKRTTTCEQNQMKAFEEKGGGQRSNTDSPYAFDDDENDVTTRIRLEPLRDHHLSSSATKLPSSSVVVSATSTTTKVSASSNASKVESCAEVGISITSVDTTVQQLTSEKSNVETPAAALSATVEPLSKSSEMNRPHSLPPPSSTTTTPACPAPVVVSSTSISNLSFRPQVIPSSSTAADSSGSRPGSTPSATGDMFNKEQQQTAAAPQQRAAFVVTTAVGQTNTHLSSIGYHAKTSPSEKDQPTTITKPRTPIPTAIPVNSLRFTTTRESPIPTLQKSYASTVMSTKPQMTSSTQGVAMNLQTTHHHHHHQPTSQQRHNPPPPHIMEMSSFAALDPATATALRLHAKHSGGMTSPRPPTPHQIASMTYSGQVLQPRPIVDAKKYRPPAGDERSGGHPPTSSSAVSMHRQSPKPQQQQQQPQHPPTHHHQQHRFPAPQPSVSDFARAGVMSSNGAKIGGDDVTMFPGGIPVKIEKPSPEPHHPVSFRNPPNSTQQQSSSASINLKMEKPTGMPQMTSDYPPRGSIMSGTPIRRKMSEDATASPPRLISHSRQTSATPPSMNQQQGRFPKQRKDQQSRTASPLSYHIDHGFHQQVKSSSQAAQQQQQMSSFVPPGLDRALKEEIKRPSSVTSSEKRHSNDRSSPMSNTRLSHTKSPHPESSHVAHSEASSLAAAGNIPLLYAPHQLRMAPRFPRGGKLDGSGLALWHEYSQGPHQAYPQVGLLSGFPRSVRPFPTSPNMNDPLDGSRHNVLSQDFHTAQLMQQKREAIAAATRGNFRQGSMPSLFNPGIMGTLNPPIGVRPPMSSASPPAISIMDRIYMQQQTASIAASSMGSIRATPSIPVSSAHLLISQSTAAAINNRPRFSSPQAYHPRQPDTLYSTQRGGNKSAAGSPHHHTVTSQALQHHHNAIMISQLTPSGAASAAAEMMSRPGVSEASMNAANASLIAAAVKQQQQFAPRVAYYQPPSSSESRIAKAESDSALRAATEQQQRIVTSPMIRSPFMIATAADLHQQRKEQSSAVANRGMSPAGGSASNISSLQQQRPPSREIAVASRDAHDQNQLMNASAAKDLKAKGKTTLTPQGFISAIIDHNIRRYGESMEEKTQKPILALEDFHHYSYVEDVKSRPHSTSVEHRPQDIAKQQQQQQHQHEGLKSSSPMLGGRSSSGDKLQTSVQPIKIVTLHQPFLPVGNNVSTPSRMSPAPTCLSTMQDRSNSIIASIYRPELNAQAAASANAAAKREQQQQQQQQQQASEDMRSQHRPPAEVSDSSYAAAADHRNRMRVAQGKFANQTAPPPTGPPHPLMGHPSAHNPSSLDLIIRTALMGDPGLVSQGAAVVIPPHFNIDQDQFIKGHLSRASPNPHSSVNDNAQQQQQSVRQTALSVSTASRHNSRSSDTPSPSSAKFKHGSDTSSHYGSNPNICGFDNSKSSIPSTAPVQLFSALRFRTPEQSGTAAQPGGSTTSIGSRSSGSANLASQQPQQQSASASVVRIVAGGGNSSPAAYQQRTAQRPPPPPQPNNPPQNCNNNELNYEPISDDED